MKVKDNYNPDVLLCLANLSSDEVFTSPKLANQILDLIPKEIWKDKNATFLDPVCKSGVFLREIAKRLLDGLKDEIPDVQKRIDHVYGKQLFGIGITGLTALLSRRSLYCSKTANGKYSVTNVFDNEKGNIFFDATDHNWENGRCSFCGASQTEYEREEGLETHAYQFIHNKLPDKIKNMKFDVIIGNPPYQLDTGGSGRQAKPIYQLFVTQAKKLNPRYLTMIIPSRWFAGGMGLNDFRDDMLNDDRIRKLVDYLDARECFPGVDIAGGICYFLWERDTRGDCHVINRFKNRETVSKRPLNEFDVFVRSDPAVSIIKKIQSQGGDKLTKIISAVRPFGLKTNDRPSKEGDLYLISSKGEGPVESTKVTAGKDMIKKWKVMTSKTSHDHAGQPDKDGTRRVLSRVEILKPQQVCTESYIILGAFGEKRQAENCLKYVKTKFVRFLISQLSFSQDITRERFNFVPMQDFYEEWTDEKLYKKYKLAKEEIDFIESMIRPMN